MIIFFLKKHLRKITNQYQNSKETPIQKKPLIGKILTFLILRFVILISFCLVNFCGGIFWVTISSVATSFQKNYNLNTFQTNFLTIMFMIVFPLIYPIASYILELKSMRLGVFIF